VLRGPFVDCYIAETVDDHTVLTVLPPTDTGASGMKLPDALGLNMCSVDSTTTCPSTTWCKSTTACPSTTDCKSVQTCVERDAGLAADRRRSPREAASRIWPVAVS
jgi:hypothetical protein